MPPLGLSARLRKARELGRRAVSLALVQPRMVVPEASYRPRPHDGVLVLQRGDNPSVDYYLRPRLAGTETPVHVCDLSSSPGACGLIGPDGPQSLLVIVCRYAAASWLEAIDAARGRLARVAFFMDDDLPEMMRDPDLPAAARGKVALHFGDHVDRLSALSSEVWVSSQALAERYPEARPVVLGPLPEDDPPAPSPVAQRRVVYHGTDVHPHERRFVVDVAHRLAAAGSDVTVEIVGDEQLRRACAELANVQVVPQLPWAEHRERQRLHPAAISLAPLHVSPLNAARAPVKVFDAARLGAAGLYADALPYRGFVRDGKDGVLLAMDCEAWAAQILGLLTDPGRRIGLADAARQRLVALRARPDPLPPPPAA